MRDIGRRLLLKVLVVALLLVVAFWSARDGQAQGALRWELQHLWSDGNIADRVGWGGLFVTDLGGTGQNDIVSCSFFHPFVLTSDGVDRYRTRWYGERLSCEQVAVGDRDGDGVQEIYVSMRQAGAGEEARVYIIRGDTLERVEQLNLGGQPDVKGLALGDVTGNGRQEIVVVRYASTLVYDAATLALVWNAQGYGGTGLVLADIDGDGRPEIVVNGNPARVLDGAAQREKFSVPGGFGRQVDAGDLTGDGVAEIVYTSDRELHVFNGISRQSRRLVGPLGFTPSAIGVADVNGDGVAEVLAAVDQVMVFRGTDGVHLWRMPSRGSVVTALAVGDANGNGVNEIVWGVDGGSSASRVVVGDWQRGWIHWVSGPFLFGPLMVAAGDLEQDGSTEVVMLNGRSASQGGTIHAYTGATGSPRWSTLIGEWPDPISHMALGQLDQDAALEIVAAGEHYLDHKLRAYDGARGEFQWMSGSLRQPVSRLVVANVDDDPVEEILVGRGSEGVWVFDGASPIIEWDSGRLDGAVRDMAVGDLSGNGAPEVVILTHRSVYIFEGGSWRLKLHQPLPDRSPVAAGIARYPGRMAGDLILLTRTARGVMIEGWHGRSYRQQWQGLLRTDLASRLAIRDLDRDGRPEFVAYGGRTVAGPQYPSVLLIGTLTQRGPVMRYKNEGYWGEINSVDFADLTHDGYDELVFGASSLIQVNRVVFPGRPEAPTPTPTATPAATPTAVPRTPPAEPTPLQAAEATPDPVIMEVHPAATLTPEGR
jgi:hypothetical protein